VTGPASASAPVIRHSSFDVRHSSLVSVCSEIGRGHPSYLDSVLLALDRLRREGPAIPRYMVPQLCTGTSGLAWSMARTAYRLGGQGGPATWLYNRLRSPDATPSGLQLRLLGSSLRKTFTGYEGVCIVDHPLLAQILASACRVAYIHGEISAPGLSAVPGAWRTFVPLEATAQKLEAFGVSHERLFVTGLVVEPELTDKAESTFRARIARLASDQPLTIGFFASGAEPRPHTAVIAAGLASVTRAGHKAVVSWGTGMLKAAKTQFALRRAGALDESFRVIWGRDRRSSTAAVAGAFPDLDLMVCAAHERTGWAVGLGLPMLALLPHIGPFAPDNFAFASEQGVCLPLDGTAAAARLDDTLAELRRSGRLAEMARSGWGRYPINGAETIARALLSAT
jgi:hypothetical protein